MPTKDATQQGVPAESENDTPETLETPTTESNSQRVSSLDDLAERNEAQMLEELGIKPEEPETPAVEAAAPETPETPEPPAETPDAPVELDPNAKVKIKVDGEEQIVTWGEAQKRMQLEEASRRRMDEAARLKKDAEVERAALAAERAASQQQPPKQEDKGKREKIRTALETLYEGEPDKAAEMFEELLETGRQPATPDQTDPDKVAEIVEARIEEKTALKQFAEEYKDLLQDTYLADIADSHLNAIRDAEPTLPFAKALKKAGDATRDWMKQNGLGATPATETPATPDPSRETRLQKKAGIDKVPTLSVVPGTTPEAPDETQDRLNAVREIQRARGQAG